MVGGSDVDTDEHYSNLLDKRFSSIKLTLLNECFILGMATSIVLHVHVIFLFSNLTVYVVELIC